MVVVSSTLAVFLRWSGWSEANVEEADDGALFCEAVAPGDRFGQAGDVAALELIELTKADEALLEAAT